MHFLHAILVKLEGPPDELSQRSPEELRHQARQLAEAAIEPYQGQVWHSYDNVGAGHWADAFPGELLGAEEPERFALVLFDLLQD